MSSWLRLCTFVLAVLCGIAGPRQAFAQGSTTDRVGWMADLDVVLAWQDSRDADCAELEQIGREVGFATTCSSDTRVAGFSGDVGVTFARYLAAKVGFLSIGSMTVDASATQGPFSLSADGQFGPTRGVTMLGGVRVPAGPVVWFAEAGLWRWSADVRVRVALMENGLPLETDSSSDEVSGWDPILGAGVEYWFTERLGMSGTIRIVQASPEGDEGGEDVEVDETFTAIFVGLKLAWN